MNGKGDKNRVTDKLKYDQGYEAIDWSKDPGKAKENVGRPTRKSNPQQQAERKPVQLLQQSYRE
jgi:hypothetical protein